MSFLCRHIAVLLVFSCANRSFAQSEIAGQRVDFKKQVYPILAQRCFSCHQGAKAASGLRLDVREELLGRSNGQPVVVPGNSGKSRLIAVVLGKIPGKKMPRKGPPLTAEQITLLKAWIDQGLAWDAALLPDKLPTEEGPSHWAFTSVRRPTVPGTNPNWTRTPVDAFISQALHGQGLRQGPMASKQTLVRRLYLDLLGLPPTPAQVEAFCSDTDEQAYEKLVECLLASPHYGEHAARHWLDVARWAESEGYESNHPRPYAWRYRDWVVDAFNCNKPFDAFVREQLAGDEIAPLTDENIIATGFLAGGRLSSNEEDRFRQKNDVYVDIVNATASAFLGLTMQCAQCHNHKFDPISARDYYRWQGFFLKGQPANVALTNPEMRKQYLSKKPANYDSLVARRTAMLEEARAHLVAKIKQALAPETLEALKLPMDQRSMVQEKLARQADVRFQFSEGQVVRRMPEKQRQDYEALKKQIAALEKGMPDEPQTFAFYSAATAPERLKVLPMLGFYPPRYDTDELSKAHPYLLISGDVQRPSRKLDVGWPEVFGPGPKAPMTRPRLALANWLTDRKNPLTARVFVNRLWLQHFGRGIVTTPGDFGIKGAPPTHSDLLDWLAAEFMESKWDIKHMHRLMVLSNTYRQSARVSPVTKMNSKLDPDNRYYWRFETRRLSAETIRDSMLAVSGNLDEAVGGPSVKDYAKSQRRGLYLFQKRDAPPRQQILFDGPSTMSESCSVRLVTTVPLQALYLLNSEFSEKNARSLASQVRRQAGADQNQQVELAFLKILGRRPDPRELELARSFFQRYRQPDSRDDNGLSPLVAFCQALMNVNEFVYLP